MGLPSWLNSLGVAAGDLLTGLLNKFEEYPAVHAAWIGPLLLVAAYYLGCFFDYVGKLEQAELEKHRKTGVSAGVIHDDGETNVVTKKRN